MTELTKIIRDNYYYYGFKSVRGEAKQMYHCLSLKDIFCDDTVYKEDRVKHYMKEHHEEKKKINYLKGMNEINWHPIW